MDKSLYKCHEGLKVITWKTKVLWSQSSTITRKLKGKRSLHFVVLRLLKSQVPFVNIFFWNKVVNFLFQFLSPFDMMHVNLDFLDQVFLIKLLEFIFALHGLGNLGLQFFYLLLTNLDVFVTSFNLLFVLLRDLIQFCHFCSRLVATSHSAA